MESGDVVRNDLKREIADVILIRMRSDAVLLQLLGAAWGRKGKAGREGKKKI